MHGAQLREFHMPRFAIAVGVIALFAAVLAPTAGATSPSQDQYGSALPGVGGGNGGGSPSTSSSPSGTAESTIPVAPSSSSSSSTQASGTATTGTATTGTATTATATTATGGSGTGSSHADSNRNSSHKGNGAKPTGNNANELKTPTAGQNAGQSVPHIAADSAGDSWVPWFIGGLLALAAAGAVLVYRNRRRAAQS